MQVQPAVAVDTAVGLVDSVQQNKDFPLKFCTVCASNQNRFVPLSLPFFVFFFFFSQVLFTRDGASAWLVSFCGFLFLSSVENLYISFFFLSFFFSFFHIVMRGKDRVDGEGFLQNSSHDDIPSRNYHSKL